VILLLVALTVWRRRQQINSIARGLATPMDASTGIVEPFTLASPLAAVVSPGTRPMPYGSGAVYERSKPPHGQFMPSYSGVAASSSLEPPTSENGPASSQPRMVHIDADVLQQVLHEFSGVIARMERPRGADGELQPPVYSEAVGHV
jgi:hypothetical protein